MPLFKVGDALKTYYAYKYAHTTPSQPHKSNFHVCEENTMDFKNLCFTENKQKKYFETIFYTWEQHLHTLL